MTQEVGDRAIVEVYKSYIADANELRASRATENSIRVTVATLFLAGQAYIAGILLPSPVFGRFIDLSFVSAVPVLGIVLVSWIGNRFCGNWVKLMADLTADIKTKFDNLRQMEEQSAALRTARGTLFMREYKQRHPDYSVPPLPANSPPAPASPTPSVAPQDASPAAAATGVSPQSLPTGARAVGLKPQSHGAQRAQGAGFSAKELGAFFQATFRVGGIGVIIAKAIVVVIALPFWTTTALPLLDRLLPVHL